MSKGESYRDITSVACNLKNNKVVTHFSGAYSKVQEELQTRSKEILESPYMIEVMPNISCNLACNGCSYFLIRKNQRGHIDLDIYVNNVLESLTGDTKSVYFSGGGEPTIFKPFSDFVSKTYEKINHISLQTNGVQLSRIRESILRKIELISLSFYGHNEKTFEKVTNSFHWSTLDKSLSYIFDRKKTESINTKMTAKIMIGPDNYKEVLNMIEYCIDKGFDIIFLRLLQDIEAGYTTSKRKSLDEKQIDEMRKILETESDSPFIEVFLKNVLGEKKNFYGNTCYTTKMGMLAIIDPFGEVYIGTPEIGNNGYSIGNINKGTLSDIWGSPKHKEVIDKMNSDCKSGTCQVESCRHSPIHYKFEEDKRNGVSRNPLNFI